MRLLMCTLALLPAPILSAATIGQMDTFQSLTTAGWAAGGGPGGGVPAVPPTVVATGGPGGAGDAYLRITSTGVDDAPGGRLVANNVLGQWSGNYLAAGITGISMDLRNFGTTDLVIRLYFEDPIPGPPANEAVTAGVALPAGGGWTKAFFPISTTSVTVLSGTAAGALSNVRVLRIFHSTTADFPPSEIAASLGVDNITATPEPGTWVLAGLGMAAAALWRRRSAAR